ncbi:MAG: hypothetical protein IKZ41_01430 [Clostridia bacterium]|nr:hypothetical protein [Clostridia bacterium]MBR5364765.1 hypothetical protein [Clostridia bacterium]
MTCPYCTCEMERGVIQSPHEIVWTKEKRRSLFRKPRFLPLAEGSVVLAEWSLSGSTVEAFYCRACRKIVIDPMGGGI